MAYLKLSRGLRTFPWHIWFFEPGKASEGEAARACEKAKTGLGGEVVSASEPGKRALKDVALVGAGLETPSEEQRTLDPWDVSSVQKKMLARLAEGSVMPRYKEKLTTQALVKYGFAEYGNNGVVVITDEGRGLLERFGKEAA